MDYPQVKRAIEVIQALLHPQTGCAWDLEQTHKSLLKYLLEESYEFIEACELNEKDFMREELGDVLLQVLLHATMAEKSGLFNLEDVAKGIADKMIRRHPHVFGEKAGRMSAEEIVTAYKEIKTKEKGEAKYSIEHKLLYAPALESAFRIGEKSTTVNFDWDNHLQVMMKVEEEWQEVKEELPPTGKFNSARVREEIGDLLFSVAQLARHLGQNPEECLREANDKFIKRFQKVEDLVKKDGKTLSKTPQAELEKYWNQVKKL